jgi:hypothetical protein
MAHKQSNSDDLARRDYEEQRSDGDKGHAERESYRETSAEPWAKTSSGDADNITSND